MNGIISKIKGNMRNISTGIIIFTLIIIINFGSYFIIKNIKILYGINVIHMLYVFPLCCYSIYCYASLFI